MALKLRKTAAEKRINLLLQRPKVTPSPKKIKLYTFRENL